MDENKKQKIAFLFGAGCEGKGQFELPSGIEFLKDTFFCEKTNEIIPALEKFFCKKNLYFDNSYNYGKSTLVSSNFSNKILKNLAETGKSQKISKETYSKFKEILDNFLEGRKKEVFIKDDALRDILGKKEKITKFEFEAKLQIGFASFLDGYFHTIINPKKYGPRNFSKVFNYYWSCFFSIIDSLLKSEKLKTDSFAEYFTSENKIDHIKILQNLSAFIKKLYENTEIDYDKTYYQEIKKQLEEKQIECPGVITTNYFKFAEKVYKETAYINGTLKWFEFPELLEVREYSEKPEIDKKHIFFPFIFGQSYLKPVVNKFQTEEFHKFGKILDKSDVLVILGYNINEDDNHVNSFIHDFLKNPSKKLFFVTDEDELKRKNKLLNQLKIDESEQIKAVQVDYAKETKDIVQTIFNEIS